MKNPFVRGRRYDEKLEKNIVSFWRKVKNPVINKTLLRKEMPRALEPSSGSLLGATGIMTKVENIKLFHVDEEEARRKGIELMTSGCKAMSESKLDAREKDFYFSMCEGEKLKPMHELIKAHGESFERDIKHLGSAFILKEKDFATADHHLLGFKKFIKEIEIKSPSEY
ncbi:MAG: hypothetical protein B6U95_09105 [Thermofilum sp. ex4484_82]|nr:MAG: hypothetical protein B6U95_09105 [Thermofilum sp. ex4484_82]OYT36006.1 MAG: hypothetical protein B6U96_09110 [Archaeoglobales archaeon ex4484_92]